MNSASRVDMAMRPCFRDCVRARTPAFGFIGIRMVIIGIRLQTWTRVIVNRCIGKIIAGDLSLVAS